MKRFTATLMAIAMVTVFCACSDGGTDVSSADSSTSIPEVSVNVSDIITSLTSEQVSSDDVSSEEEIDKSEQASSDTSSEPQFTVEDEVLSNVSTEKAGQDAGISISEALILYRATVNDGRLCVWKKTENKEKRGVDVELLMYDEEDDRLEYVITYTVENRRFNPFNMKNDGYLYQYRYMTDSTRDVFFDNSFDDMVDITGEIPRVMLRVDYAYPATEDEISIVEYGTELKHENGKYQVYASHPEYGKVDSLRWDVNYRFNGDYAVMIFQTDENFTEATSTMILYDYVNKTETVIDTVEGEDCGYTMYRVLSARFAGDDHLVVHNGADVNTYVYEIATGKKTDIDTEDDTVMYNGDGISKCGLTYSDGHIMWREGENQLRSMCLADNSMNILLEDAEIYLFETKNDKFLVKTGGYAYEVDAGELYVSDGATLTLIDRDVYCYFFVNDTLWYQVGDGEGNYEWFSRAW